MSHDQIVRVERSASSWLPQVQQGVYPIVSMGVSNPGYVVYTIYDHIKAETDGPKSAECLLQQIRSAFLCRAAEAPDFLHCTVVFFPPLLLSSPLSGSSWSPESRGSKAFSLIELCSTNNQQ